MLADTGSFAKSHAKYMGWLAANSSRTWLLWLLVASWSAHSVADEGMLPISEVSGMDLSSRGIRLSGAEIFTPEAVSLVDGVVRVNGCTGSFVSDQGLILTNHHCAYRAIQTNSTAQRDLLADGFLAETLAAELPAPGYTVRITQAYRDVSQEVLSAVRPELNFAQRTMAIERQSKLLEQQAERQHPGLRAEVAEMFVGETYGLFLYTYIRDVRLVFAPPAAIGSFGGDVDNWEWPRHTGDFTFMRAYVAPDGSSADYAAENVPYRPKRHLQVRADGVDEGDTVMLLGYPGRTARHHTADYLRLQRDVMLPWIVEFYQWQIEVMEAAGRENRSVALKHTDRIKSLANVEKRSRGQLLGLQRAGIVQQRAAEEQRLREFIAADPQRQARYGQTLDGIAAVYREIAESAPRELLEKGMIDACRTLNLAFGIYDAARERQKPDLEREPQYMDRNFDQTIQRWRLAQRDLDLETDRQILSGLLERLVRGSHDPEKRKLSPEQLLGQPIDSWFRQVRWTDEAFFEQALKMTPQQLSAVNDPAMKWVVAMYPRLSEIRLAEKSREGRLNQLYGELITVKKQFLAADFVPDANGTLRLTSGTVKGFSPADAVYKSPLTTLRGLVEKTTQEDPFITPPELLEHIEAGRFGNFVHAGLGQVPVNMLYDTDTTGGNSGSPIMDADGRLVGVNFDRAFEATINDFAWNADYSRSIGVDIRYILWVTGIVFGADGLLEEMGVAASSSPAAETGNTAGGEMPKQPIDPDAAEYWVFLTTGEPPAGVEPSEIARMQAAHLDNFKRLHGEDKLAAAGPLGDPQRRLRGIVFARADDLDSLNEYFLPDPFIQHQFLKVEAFAVESRVGQFHPTPSPTDMAEFQIAILEREDDVREIPQELEQQTWQQLAAARSPGGLRIALQLRPADQWPSLHGVVLFKRPTEGQDDPTAQLLQQLPIIAQGHCRFTIMPLYMSADILDDLDD